MRDERLILALDGVNYNQAIMLAKQLGPFAYAVKAHDLVYDEGMDVIGELKRAGALRVWMDAKLHDIPKTVRRSAQALKRHGADIITVHAPGGREMMEAAIESGAEIYAVTVLTSLDPRQVELSFGRTPAEAVVFFAEMAAAAGVAGIVCSPQDVASLGHLGPQYKRVIPGTRSTGVAVGDQKRVTTPLAALQAGADYLVIGSQVVEAADPVAEWRKLVEEIAG